MSFRHGIRQVYEYHTHESLMLPIFESIWTDFCLNKLSETPIKALFLMLREIFLITTFFCSGSSLCGGTVYSNKPTIAEHTENNTSSFIGKTLYCFFSLLSWAVIVPASTDKYDRNNFQRTVHALIWPNSRNVDKSWFSLVCGLTGDL